MFRPLLDELKRLTERPRTIERLRSEQTVYQNRIETTDAAITYIKETLTTIEDPVVKKALKATLEQWQNSQEDASSHLERIHAQLERLTTPSQESGQGFVVTLQEFVHGRGLNLALALALALGGFALTYLLLAGLGRLVGALINRGREPSAHWMAPAIALGFRGLTLILALLIATLILYARGDWVVLGLLVLLVVGLVGIAAVTAALPARDPYSAQHGQCPGRRAGRLQRDTLENHFAQSVLDLAQSSVARRLPAVTAG